MKEWISANGGALAFVIVGVSVGGYQNDRVGLALICFGVVWWAASRVRLVGRYLPRVRVTWVPAERGWFRRRRAENIEERAVRLAQRAQLDSPKPDRQPTPEPAPEASEAPRKPTPRTVSPVPSRAPRLLAASSEPKPHVAARARAEALLTAGQALMDELLKARRQRSTNPMGIVPAVNAVGREVREWNAKVAQEVDNSPLPFKSKITLKIYHEHSLTEMLGPSPERIAAVLENNMALLSEVVRAHSHG